MARKVRIQYRGAICHVMNQGDRRQAIFKDEEDRQRLLQSLRELNAQPQPHLQAQEVLPLFNSEDFTGAEGRESRLITRPIC